MEPKSDKFAKVRSEYRKKGKQRIARKIFLGILGVILFLAFWQLLYEMKVIAENLLIPPIAVLKTIFRKFVDPTPDGAVMLAHIWASLQVALIGFLVANVIGVPLGLFMGWYRLCDRFVRPVFEVIRPIPAIAWIPIVIIFLGIGVEAKAVIIFFSAFIPSVINSYTGIRSTPQVYISMAKTCGSSNWKAFLRIGVPASLPMVFAGMRISLGNAWSTLVAAEMLAANKGLGYMIIMGRTYSRVDIIMSGMLMIGIIGVIFSWIFDFIEHRVVKGRNR